MKNLDKLQTLVAGKDDNIIKEAQYRIENQLWLKEAKNIAFKILSQLKEKGMSQKEFASLMHVSPQQINKWVKGNENFSLDTLSKIQNILDIPIMASYYEKDIVFNVIEN